MVTFLSFDRGLKELCL